MTRRSRTAEHGLERRGKPIVLPLLALLIALYGWWDTNVAAQGAASSETVGQPHSRSKDYALPAISDSELVREHPSSASATPQFAASPSWVIYRSEESLVEFTLRLTEEER